MQFLFHLFQTTQYEKHIISACVTCQRIFPKKEPQLSEPVLTKCLSIYEETKGSATIVWYITEYEQVLTDLYV